MAVKRKIKESDFDHVAEYVRDTFNDRKKNRQDLDLQIREIDRQIEMIPRRDHKLLHNGQLDPNKAWLPEIELPLQAEALEVITADVRTMQSPDSGPWFAAHSETSDEYLDRANFASIIAGDLNEVPTLITQDSADKLVVGFINHFHRQYDFRGNLDIINAESISYGMGIGRVKKIRKTVFLPTSKGVVKEEKEFPVLIPRSLKETYLDDREHIIMQEGFMVGPLTIFKVFRNWEDVKKQATAGSNDPMSEIGGWRKNVINKIIPDDNGNIELLEAEGDFIIPRKTNGSIRLPGTIVTVVVGKANLKIIRLRFRKEPFDSVLTFPYHKENALSVYGSSPLRKGLPLQAMATEALMRVVEASALNSQPPIGYDRTDMWFAQKGGPVLEPSAIWATISDIEVHKDIGDPTGLMTVYLQFLQQYADVVGVNRARLGAQTVSHTTAFAKQAELQRGQSRTVDFVRSTLQGPLTRFLDMEYKMAKGFRGTQTFYIDAYRGFVEIENKHLPDKVVFEAHGAGEPQERELIRQRKLQGLQQAMQMDQLGIQLGAKPVLSLPNLIQETLTESGWVDTDPLMNQEEGGGQIPQQLPQELGAQ